ncbi:MAG: hypothetical protein ACRDMV_25200 [Streptosporangiales bacterium]
MSRGKLTRGRDRRTRVAFLERECARLRDENTNLSDRLREQREQAHIARQVNRRRGEMLADLDAREVAARHEADAERRTRWNVQRERDQLRRQVAPRGATGGSVR